MFSENTEIILIICVQEVLQRRTHWQQPCTYRNAVNNAKPVY